MEQLAIRLENAIQEIEDCIYIDNLLDMPTHIEVLRLIREELNAYRGIL